MSLEQTAAEEVRARYIERLKRVSILDPACGSGNFLYLALQGVKDIENRANLECEALGLPPRVNEVGPEILHGIEINPVAAELARTAIWIGDIQWRRRNGIHYDPPPILRKLDNIECRDALIEKVADGSAVQPSPPVGEGAASLRETAGEGSVDAAAEQPSSALRPSRRAPSPTRGEGSACNVAHWREASWPATEFIVGNPPFLGGKLLRKGLGDEYVETLFGVFEGRVPPEADFVTYWFEKTGAQLKLGRAQRAGLVATNSIRGGANRRVLERVAADASIFEAWSDEPWIVEGAAVRVSLICVGQTTETLRLDGKPTAQINADLTSGSLDLTLAKRLDENRGAAFMGDTKGGAFDVSGKLARAWLLLPANPNRRANAEVLRPWRNGQDLTRRPADKWIIDFGWEMSESDAALFEGPFEFVREHVKPERAKNRRESYRERWWRHVEPRPALLAGIGRLDRYIVTPTVAKHRLFVWLDRSVVPDHQLIVMTRDDDTTFGILHSRFHEAWSLRLGTSLEDRPRYTPTTTFETFPFPEGLTPNIPASDYADDPRAIAIAKAAKRLDELRNAWLNPSDLVKIEPEVVPTAAERAAGAKKIYPDRFLPRSAETEAKLNQRTLTKLYNQRPQWLDDAHRELNAAVAAAYGWPADIPEEEALRELLDLNLTRGGVPNVHPGAAYIVAPLTFEKISEVENIRLSETIKRAVEDLADTDLSTKEVRRDVVRRLKQVTR